MSQFRKFAHYHFNRVVFKHSFHISTDVVTVVCEGLTASHHMALPGPSHAPPMPLPCPSHAPGPPMHESRLIWFDRDTDIAEPHIRTSAKILVNGPTESLAIFSTRFVAKPEGVSNAFLTKPVGVNEKFGVERHQRGLNHRQIEHCFPSSFTADKQSATRIKCFKCYFWQFDIIITYICMRQIAPLYIYCSILQQTHRVRAFAVW